MKAPHEAIAELQEVGRLAPDDGRPYRIMGLIYKGYHQREQAKTAYEEALRRHLEPHVVAEVLLEYSEVLVDTGHPTEALERLAQCPERFGEEPYALALKGECLWQLGRVDEATVLVDRALHADSNSLPGLRMRASIYLELQQPEKALPLLVRYVHLDPISNQARKLLAQTYRLLGETGKAEEQTKLRDRLYDFNQRVMNVNTELIKNPQNDELRYQIGMLWLGIGQYAEARQWFISALEINAKNSKAKQALEQIDPAAAAQFGK
jgi:Tfp pilus assembly protein PilF